MTSAEFSSSFIFLDEKLPGPLYGLPAIDSHLLPLVACCYQPAKANIHARCQKFKLHLLSMSAMWNASVPIHTLSAEILLEIFEYSLVMPLSKVERKSRRSVLLHPWTLLMGVCRHWCALIRNTTSFWRDIAIFDDTRWLSLALQRLGQSAVRITLHPRGAPFPAIPRLIPHADRIEHLDTQGAFMDPGHFIEPLLECTFPILTKLTIPVSQPHDIPLPTFVQDRYPRLTSLHLSQFSISWSKSLLANMQSLSLQECQLSPPLPLLSLTSFLDVLEQGRQLRSLELDRFLCKVLESSSSLQGRLINLPRLSVCGIKDTTAHIVQLMTHLGLSTSCCISLEATNSKNVIYASLLPDDLSRFPSLSRVSALSVELREYAGSSAEFTLPNNAWYRLAFPANATGPMSITVSLSHIIESFLTTTALTRLSSLHVSGGRLFYYVWDDIFDSLPAMQTLTFVQTHTSSPADNPPKFPIPILQSLAGSKDSAPRCPQLQVLRIATKVPFELEERPMEIPLKLLRARVARGMPRLRHLALKVHWDADLTGVEDVAENFSFK